MFLTFSSSLFGETGRIERARVGEMSFAWVEYSHPGKVLSPWGQAFVIENSLAYFTLFTLFIPLLEPGGAHSSLFTVRIR